MNQKYLKAFKSIQYSVQIGSERTREIHYQAKSMTRNLQYQLMASRNGKLVRYQDQEWTMENFNIGYNGKDGMTTRRGTMPQDSRMQQASYWSFMRNTQKNQGLPREFNNGFRLHQQKKLTQIIQMIINLWKYQLKGL